jgi:hypothetical protein
MSALRGIDISTGFAEKVALPVAGTMATEMAIRATRIGRTAAIGNYRARWIRRQPGFRVCRVSSATMNAFYVSDYRSGLR